MKAELRYYVTQTRSLADRAMCADSHQDDQERHRLSERGRKMRTVAERDLDLVDLFTFNDRGRR